MSDSAESTEVGIDTARIGDVVFDDVDPSGVEARWALSQYVAEPERSGYVAIERYNDNPYAHRWFEKPLT